MYSRDQSEDDKVSPWALEDIEAGETSLDGPVNRSKTEEVPVLKV